jgi:hypothetical protein
MITIFYKNNWQWFEKGSGLTFFIVWFDFSQRRRVAARNPVKS